MSLDPVSLFQSFRTILCVCPCCGDIVRVSDLKIRYEGKAPKTWLDTYDLKSMGLDKKEANLDEKESEMREAAAERGRKQVPKLVCRCLEGEITRLKYNPYDIKALLHPVDFVVFNGMNDGIKVKDIAFVSKATTNQMMNKLHQSLKSTIEKEQYEWQVTRVSLDGKITLE
jgi:predicted Holliday junction resolvase-like endonuclease